MNDGWIPRLIAAIVGAIVLVASFFVGVVFFIAALGLAVIGWFVMSYRVWRLRRRQARRPDHGAGGRGSGSTTVEGEYRVVQQKESRDE